MITIKIKAGLVNQLFQYALARSIREKTKKKIVLDLSYYNNGVAKGDTVRGYVLDNFNINKDLTVDYTKTPKTISFLEKITRRLFNESSFIFYKKYLNPKDGSYLIGFWNNEKYFKDIEEILRKEFVLKDGLQDQRAKNILEKIRETKNSVSINIRRGDYANNSKIRNHHGLLDLNYYKDDILSKSFR